jgi:hypothetical protein
VLTVLSPRSLLTHAIAALMAFACIIHPAAADSPQHQVDDRNQAPPTLPAGLVGAAATRTSPFDPPTENAFVTDDSPGLDTGCTFETSSQHPLIINVAIDKAVGPVNANGYLIDADSLIANGVIPSAVQIITPAWDIDLNGGPPPEQDDLYLNGEYIGTFSGNNNEWKLNTFTVDVRKLKFPAPGATVTPALNTFTIYIDTAPGSHGNWCMSVDWIAIILAIEDVAFGLEITPIVSNPIMVDDPSSTALIDTIWRESTGAVDCNFSVDAGMGIAEVPFSAPALSSVGFQPGNAKLQFALSACTMVGGAPSSPANPPLPDVEVDWSIPGTSLASTENWTGLTGNVTLEMPDKVGVYDVVFDIKLDGESFRSLTRRLYVTKQVPVAAVATPRRTYYEKAATWANGKILDTDILTDLLSGIYSYGDAHWRYGYVNWGTCSASSLISEPLGAGGPTCDYGDCYRFSEVLDLLAGTLGLASLQQVSEHGTTGAFVTVATASLDNDFRGQVEPLPMPDDDFDRYRFSSHSLRKQVGASNFYDATFNGIYALQDEFIAWNMAKTVVTTPWGPIPIWSEGADATGAYYQTQEGVKLYRQNVSLPGFYSIWGETLAYDPSATGGSTVNVMASTASAPSAAGDVLLTGATAYTTPDENGDGVWDALVADIGIEVVTPASYEITAVLMKNGTLVADRPVKDSALATRANIGPSAGVYTAQLRFSGQQISQSGLDGPYDLVLLIQGPVDLDFTAVTTPAVSHALFGETKGTIGRVTETPIDPDGDARFDSLRMDAELDIKADGTFILQGALVANANTIANASDSQTLSAGVHTMTLDFDGVQIVRSVENGPYDVLLTLIDAADGTQHQITVQTRPYDFTDFEGRIDPTGTMSDRGVDTNGNGFFDLLRVQFSANVRDPDTYLVAAALRNLDETKVVFSEQLMLLAGGIQSLTIDIDGPEILSQQIDGPYVIDLTLRDPATNEVLDAVRLPQPTLAYQHTAFEQFGARRPSSLSASQQIRASTRIPTVCSIGSRSASMSRSLPRAPTCGAPAWRTSTARSLVSSPIRAPSPPVSPPWCSASRVIR